MPRTPILLQLLVLGLGFAITAFGREESYRIVVTFLTAKDNNITGVDLTGIKVVKQYGRRLVLDLGKPYDLKVQQLFFKNLFKSVQRVDPDLLVGIMQMDIGQIIINDTLSVSPLEMTMNSNNPDVDGVYIDSASQTPLWNLLDSEPYSIHVEGVWKVTNSTPNVVVAVIDTGMAAAARDVFLNLVDGYDFISDDWLSLDGDERDSDATDPGDWGDMCPISSWHGTKVASILAARHENEWGMKGVAQNCSVMPIRVLGMCRMGYASDVADSIVWAAGGSIDGVLINPNPANIISLSLAGQGACPGYLQSAISQARTLGAVVIAAAGNNNQNASGYFPANCRGVMAIAASTRDGKLAGYSNWGNLIASSAPGGDTVNAIMTLGVDELETGLHVSYGLGTSFSVPHVSGIIALIRNNEKKPFREEFVRYTLTIKNSSRSANLTCNTLKCASSIFDVSKLMVLAVSCGQSIGSYTRCFSDMDGFYNCFCSCPGGYKYQFYTQVTHSSNDEWGYLEWRDGYEGCFSCDAGHYCPGGQSGSYPYTVTTCSAGNYLSTIPSSSSDGKCSPCGSCGVGNYLSGCGGSSAGSCLSCPGCLAGQYRYDCSMASSGTCTTCSTCGSGYYKVGCSGIYSGSCQACTACGAGNYRSSPCGDVSAGVCTQCESCPAGKYRSECGGSSAGSCQDCPSCPAGKYSVGCSGTSSGTCTSCTNMQCEPGWYVCNCGGTSQGYCCQCLTCSLSDKKYYSTQCGGTTNSVCGSCTACSAGQYNTGCGGTNPGTCVSCENNCASNSYRAGCGGINAGECKLCNCGDKLYAINCGGLDDGQCTPCRDCEAGEYRSAPCEYNSPGTCSSCPACNAGTYRVGCSGSTSGTCPACPTGSYCLAGTNPPTPCPAGTYSGITGAVSIAACSNCPPGTYRVSTGGVTISDCTACPAGTYSGTAGASSDAVCTTCPKGSYCPAGSNRTTPCLAGRFSGVDGASSAATCTECPRSSYCPAGASAHIPCPAGTFGLVAGASTIANCQNCTAGTASAAGSTNCTPCILGTSWSLGRAATCSACVDKTCTNAQYKVPCSLTSNIDCAYCPSPPSNALLINASDPACLWTCNSGYYRNAGTCVACTTTSVGCSSGQYRKQCVDGGTADGQCVACTNGPVNSVYTGVSTTGITSSCPYDCISPYVKFGANAYCCSNCGNGYYNPTCTLTSSGSCSTCNN